MRVRGVELLPDPEQPVAALAGDIDCSNARQLREVLESCVPNTATVLVLDLSGVTYLDSAGLQLLFRLASRLRERQQRLRLRLPHTSRLHRVLVLADVAAAMEVTSDDSDAPGLPPCPRG